MESTDPKTCDHPSFGAQCHVTRVEDLGKFLAELRIRCSKCGLPFQFSGVPDGISYDHPTAQDNGTVMTAPLKPLC